MILAEDMLPHALHVARTVGPVLPLAPGRLVPLVPYSEATRVPEDVRRLWAMSRHAGIGVYARGAQLLVIDVDVKHDRPGFETMRRLIAELGPLPPTLTHRTPSGGLHLVFHAEDGIRKAQNELRGAAIEAPAVDIIAGHGILRWPPTAGYAPVRTHPIGWLPDAWLDALRDPPAPPRRSLPPMRSDSRARRYALAALVAEASELAMVGAARNPALYHAACVLGQLIPHLLAEEIETALLIASEKNGSLRENGERKCRNSIARGIRWGAENPRRLPDERAA
jgi:hypothetical protein